MNINEICKLFKYFFKTLFNEINVFFYVGLFADNHLIYSFKPISVHSLLVFALIDDITDVRRLDFAFDTHQSRFIAGGHDN